MVKQYLWEIVGEFVSEREVATPQHIEEHMKTLGYNEMQAYNAMRLAEYPYGEIEKYELDTPRGKILVYIPATKD
jgi:hypothetical protein